MAKYIDNAELLALVVCYQETKDKRAMDSLAIMFSRIAKESLKTFRLGNHQAIEDMIQDATLQCLSVVDRFDVSRSPKPFNYFTTVIFNHYRQQLRSMSNYTNAINRYADTLHLKIDE